MTITFKSIDHIPHDKALLAAGEVYAHLKAEIFVDDTQREQRKGGDYPSPPDLITTLDAVPADGEHPCKLYDRDAILFIWHGAPRNGLPHRRGLVCLTDDHFAIEQARAKFNARKEIL